MLYAALAMSEVHINNGPLESLPNHDISGELPEELPRGLVERLEDLQRRLGRCEGRLELTQAAENVLRMQLEREIERADRLEQELRQAEADLRYAEAALHKSHRGGWFKRFFGVGAVEQD